MNKLEEKPNQMKRGRRRLGIPLDKKLSEKRLRDVYEAGCPAGGKAEFIRNYDGQIKVRRYIQQRLGDDIRPEKIYDELVEKNWI